MHATICPVRSRGSPARQDGKNDERKPSMIALIRHRNFSLLWTAGLLSLLGDWAVYTIVPLFILDSTDSIFLAGIIWAVIAIPNIIFSPLSGVYVDRWNKRNIMLTVALIQAGVMLPLLALGDRASIWVIFALVFTLSSMVTLYAPAENSLMSRIVPEELLVSANSLNTLNDNLARIAGPAIGAAVYSTFGLAGIATLNGASFILSAALVALVPAAVAILPHGTSESQELNGEMSIVTTSGARGIWLEFAAGVQSVVRDGGLRVIFLIFIVVILADAPITAILAAFTEGPLGGSDGDYGTIISARGVAGVVGAIIITQFAKRLRDDLILLIGLFILGGGIVVLSLAQDIYQAIIIMLVLGPGVVASQTGIISSVQRMSAPTTIGRAFSLLGMLAGIGAVIGTLIGSVLGELASPRIVMAVSGVLYIGAALMALLVWRTRGRAEQSAV